MPQRESLTTMQPHSCPECGMRLVQDGDVLVCANHGAFFAYGPHLLVRAAQAQPQPPRVPMPWDVAPVGRAR